MSAKTMADIVGEFEIESANTVAVRSGLVYARRVQDLRSGSRTSRHTSGTDYVRARARRDIRREVSVER